MDTRPINGTLTVSAFNPTGNPGEYSFDSAAYNNQADESGNGAYDVAIGWVIYVPSTNFNTSTQLPGVLHRYRLTEVTASDPQTLSGTMVWDETGAEGLEVPTNGVGCGMSQTSPGVGFGYAPDDAIYPELAVGSAVQSVQTDLWAKADTQESGGGTPGATFKATIGDGSNLSIVLTHQLNTKDVSVSIYELATGADVYPGVARTGPDVIQLDFTYPIEPASHRVVVRA